MPYDIWRRDGKFEVHKRGEPHVLGTHDTREEAQKQIEAIYASEGK